MFLQLHWCLVSIDKCKGVVVRFGVVLVLFGSVFGGVRCVRFGVRCWCLVSVFGVGVRCCFCAHCGLCVTDAYVSVSVLFGVGVSVGCWLLLCALCNQLQQQHWLE